MTARPTLSDVIQAFSRAAYQRWRSESFRARARLIFIAIACLALGWIGPWVFRLLPSPTGEFPRPADPLTLPPLDLWFVLPAIVGVVLASIRSGHFVAQMYGLQSIVHGIRFALSTTFGFEGIVLTANHNALESAAGPNDASAGRGFTKPRVDKNEVGVKIGGPGILFIKGETAVVTERGGGFSRMLGPGGHRLQSFERVRGIVDLRQQSFSGEQLALTKDSIPVRVKTSSTFKIMPRMEGESDPPVPPPGFSTVWRMWRRQPIRPEEKAALSPFPVSREALRLAVHDLPVNPAGNITWTGMANGAATGGVGDAIVHRYLDQLFAPDDQTGSPRQEISKQVFESGKAGLAKRGIELISCGFDNIVVPPQVMEQRRQMWQVNWLKESDITRSGGEADSILQRELARAEAQVEFIQSITQAIRTMSQTHEPREEVHPLSLRFIESVARFVDQALREIPYRPIDPVQIDRLMARWQRLLPPGQPTP